MGFSRQQRIALAVLKSVSGFLSVVGSFLIICIAIRRLSSKNSRQPTYHRILLAMSIYDFSHAVWQAIGVMAVPRWTGGYGCFGTQATCEAQGFFVTLALSALICNAGLSVYYVAIVRYSVSQNFLSQRLEPVIHILAFVIPVTLGMTAFGLRLYNPIYAPGIPGLCPEIGCFAIPKPITCVFDKSTCERGRDSATWGWAFYAMDYVCALIIILMSILLWTTVRARYRKNEQYASRESGAMRERSGAVRVQALLFAGVSLYAIMWSLISHINFVVNAPEVWQKFVIFNGIIAYPLQGFLNFFIYIRPRYFRLRKASPELGRVNVLKNIIFGESAILENEYSIAQRRSCLASASVNGFQVGRFASTRSIRGESKVIIHLDGTEATSSDQLTTDGKSTTQANNPACADSAEQ